MSAQLRGVNFGGWLLLEKWMTPTLFAGTDANDEYQFLQTPDAVKKIDAHRKTFITEADFTWLQEHNINAVRIPVGYWVLKDEAPFVSAKPYLDWAMDMAHKYGIKVIIDMHGLQGSQNGYDHSGRAGKAAWFRKKAHREASLDSIVRIAGYYKDHPALWGIQIINEPRLGLLHLKLRHFYRQAYRRLNAILIPSTRIIFSDAYTPRLLATALRGTTRPTVMDVHFYHATTPLSQFFSLRWYFRKVRSRTRLLQKIARNHEIIIGEWSGVLRHEHTRTISQPQQAELFKEYVTLQLKTFAPAAGWFYWNYKTEAPGVWNYRSMVEAGDISID